MVVVLHASNWNVYHVTLLNRITGFIAFKENNIDKINLDISIILLLRFYVSKADTYYSTDLMRISELIIDLIHIKS